MTKNCLKQECTFDFAFLEVASIRIRIKGGRKLMSTIGYLQEVTEFTSVS